jgi:hypothetical protein
MARAKKTEDRNLTKDEREMVDQSRAPALRKLEGPELVGLARRLRERRDRVKTLTRSRARDSKSGAKEAGADTGAKEKKAALATAVKRVNKEIERRRGVKRAELAGKAQKYLRAALRRKQSAHQWRGPEDKTSDLGMLDLPNRKIAPSGALHAEGMRAAISRSTGDR